MAEKSLEESVGVDESVVRVLTEIQGELKTNKYSFRAFSEKGNYSDKISKIIESSFPLIYLASVSPLTHVPNGIDKYQLYTFRLKNGNGKNGNGGNNH